MKTSWIIGIFMLYMLLFSLELFATGGVSFASATSSNITNIATTNQSALIRPEFAESTNLFTSAWAVATQSAAYLVLIIKVLFLWFPTVFTGYVGYIYWYIVMAIDAGVVFSIFSIVRGVHSG